MLSPPQVIGVALLLYAGFGLFMAGIKPSELLDPDTVIEFPPCPMCGGEKGVMSDYCVPCGIEAEEVD